MTELEGRRVVKLGNLPAHSFADFPPAMPKTGAPKARQAIEDLSAISIRVIATASLDNQSRVCLELTVTRKGHPMSFKPGGTVLRCGIANIGSVHRNVRCVQISGDLVGWS